MNYLACGIMPPELSYQQRKRLRTDSRYYIWDDPLLFKRGADLIIRRCVLEGEQSKILKECHSSPYGVQEIKQLTRFFSQDFIGLRFLKTVLNG